MTLSNKSPQAKQGAHLAQLLDFARLRPAAALALVGGAAGAALLLVTPDATFRRIVPWLLLGGYLGARVARKIPAPWLRGGIVVTGLVMAGLFFAR